MILERKKINRRKTVLNFKVNDYITLKLEDGLTFIYVNGELFRQCFQLVLQIPKEDISEFDQINSIDEAAEVYETLYENEVFESHQTVSITPEQEFWGHCSNLQAWVENNYDTRLLHSNLAFPLLKELSDAGMPKAKILLKEEITKRIEEGNSTVMDYLMEEDYLSYLSRKECLDVLLNTEEVVVINELEELIDKEFAIIFGDSHNYMEPHIVIKDRSVVRLSLVYCDLCSLPESIIKFKKLVQLFLGGNLLEEVPEFIQDLPLLKSFRIYRNKIKELPTWIGKLERLESLYMGENPLQEIPDSLGSLKSLKYASFRRCKISELPNTMCNLNNLKSLDLDENQIASLSKQLLELPSLEYLSLKGNPLSVEFKNALEASRDDKKLRIRI